MNERWARPRTPTKGRSPLGLLLLGLWGLMLLGGCQWGRSAFTGDGELGFRGFDTGGTTFSYVDGHDDDLVPDPRPRVVVFMTWLIFNPAGDLNDLSGAELEDYKHEMKLRDAAALVFDDQAAVVPGATFQSSLVGGQETSDDGLSVRLHFAPERLNALTTYDAFKPYGSVRVVDVSIDAAGFVPPTPTVDGTIAIDVELGDDDPADALRGRLEGTFSAPLVDERAAEHNLGLLEADDILGVPLSPRPAEATP